MPVRASDKLAGAFFCAGSSSLTVTLWDAGHGFRGAISALYERWPGKRDKGAALREAQLSIINQLRGGKIQAQMAAGPVMLPEPEQLLR